MTKTVGFYFDFLSPYGYLGSLGIEHLGDKHGVAIDRRPVAEPICQAWIAAISGRLLPARPTA